MVGGSPRLWSRAKRPQPLVFAIAVLASPSADASFAGLCGNDEYCYAQRNKYDDGFPWRHPLAASGSWLGSSALSFFCAFVVRCTSKV